MFEANANHYDAPLDPENAHDSRSVAVKRIGKNKRVLELGPATGRVTRALLANGCAVVAVERDHVAVERLRDYCEVIEGDIEQMSLERRLNGRQFDVILAGDFLEHLQDPGQLLQELKPFLGTSGYLLASIPNVSHGSVRLGLLHGKFEYRDTGILDRTHLRFFTLESIRQMFGDAGYLISEVQRLTSDPFLEPMTGEAPVEAAKIAPEIRRHIENDAECATVQFIVSATPDPDYQPQQLSRSKIDPWERIVELEQQASEHHRHLRSLEAERADLVRLNEEAQSTSAAVINSIGWKALNRFREFRGRWLPTGSLRHKVYLRAIQPVRARLHAGPAPIANAPKTYERWLQTHEVTPKDAARDIAQFSTRPTVSIITPVFNPEVRWLKKCIESVRAQSYPDWELCICDDASTDSEVQRVLKHYADSEPRIRLHTSERNQGISLASNQALKMARGEFVALLDHDDELSPHALYWAVRLLQQSPETDVIYSDEDKLEADGTRCEPFFKPDWSPEYLQSCMYTGHLTFYRRALIEEVGGFRAGFEGSQDYDLMLRVSAKTKSIQHIPKVLYHWRKAAGSVAGIANAKPYAFKAAKRALTEHAQRVHPNAEVVEAAWKGQFRVRYPVEATEKVSIIIPTRDKMRILKTCLDSIAARTDHPTYEILIVDNGSVEACTRDYLAALPYKVLRFEGEFNYSKINNFAAQSAKGKYLLFLNNDTEVITREWMSAMLEWCQQPEIGAVGAKLFYPNRTIQHAGVFLGPGGVAAHVLCGMPEDSQEYFGVVHMTRNWAAVTAACMMVRREVFEKVGGFEERLQVAFNDVDLCLRLLQQGLRNLVTPYAQLYHYESASRGFSLDPVEVGFMRSRWGPLLENDPYYNPNLTLHASDFGLRW